jgi:hypothetical protein
METQIQRKSPHFAGDFSTIYFWLFTGFKELPVDPAEFSDTAAYLACRFNRQICEITALSRSNP